MGYHYDMKPSLANPSVSRYPIAQYAKKSLCIAVLGILCLSAAARAQAPDVTAGGIEQQRQTDTKKPEATKADAPKTATEAPVTQMDIAALADEARLLARHGAYDEVIAKVTPALKDDATADARLLYWRGYAAWRIGYFGMAEHDLALAVDAKEGKLPGPANEYLSKVRSLKEVMPQNVTEIKSGEAVVFRVYYDDLDEWTQAIIKLLPRAYAISRDMVGREMVETPGFIFNDYARFMKFYQTRGDALPGSWIWAAGGTGGFYFCSSNPNVSASAYNVKSDYFQATVIHEFNHCLVGRMTGDAQMPTWLKEGLAEIAEDHFSSVRGMGFNKRMARVLKSDAILPPAKLGDAKAFTENTEINLALRDSGFPAADPYAQSYFMAGYFLSLLPKQGLPSFLEEMRDERDYESVFEKHTGIDTNHFFHNWTRWMQSQWTRATSIQ